MRTFNGGHGSASRPRAMPSQLARIAHSRAISMPVKNSTAASSHRAGSGSIRDSSCCGPGRSNPDSALPKIALCAAGRLQKRSKRPLDGQRNESEKERTNDDQRLPPGSASLQCARAARDRSRSPGTITSSGNPFGTKCGDRIHHRPQLLVEPETAAGSIRSPSRNAVL